jgi:AAA+ superfamily predicted ATPase
LELSNDGIARRYGLICEHRDGQGVKVLAATTTAIEVLQGSELPSAARRVVRTDVVRAAQWIAGATEESRERMRSTIAIGRRCLVAITGARGGGRRSTIERAASETGRDVLVIDLDKLSVDVAAAREECRAIALTAQLGELVVVLADIDRARPEATAIAREILGDLIQGPIFVTCGVERPKLDWGRPVIVVEMAKPTTAELAKLWHEKLGCGTEEDGQRLAEQYPLSPSMIHHASEAAKARAGERDMEPDDIYAGIRSVLDDKLGQYARRVTVTQTWDDMVLPQEQIDVIVELIARVRRRSKVYEKWGFGAKVGKGLGVSALFSGPPGTGKTMVAGLIARDLGLELYQVDMAKIVSKFIGETEKNLAALFDAAEAGHAILLFDEADALFGKRTEVKSSNDRFANMETNYLLQRMETFTGVCLLTSNHERNMDPAFQRRLSLHLRFELPDEEERAKLWRATLPEQAPVAKDIDYAVLARRYEMSGGYIKNAALRAAFLAADEDSDITGAHLEHAARVEYEGMGKIAS